MKAIKKILSVLRYSDWYSGFRWPPVFSVGHDYYDGHWYGVSAGVVYVCLHYY